MAHAKREWPRTLAAQGAWWKTTSAYSTAALGEMDAHVPFAHAAFDQIHSCSIRQVLHGSPTCNWSGDDAMCGWRERHVQKMVKIWT